ncbi:MAG: hypothetical protein JW995_11475 [Melioribacteraceae bacterium]|nr:hypothetical protein [Melioribacteraceae bacterium]
MLKARILSSVFLISSITVFFFIGCGNSEEYPNAVDIITQDQQLTKNIIQAALTSTPDIVVNTTLDVEDFDEPLQIKDLPGPDGLVSLREAIIAANHTPGPQVIGFNIPASDPGFNGKVFTINFIHQVDCLCGDGITIDGSYQTVFTGNTNEAGPEIMVSGNNSDFHGFSIYSAHNRIHNIIVNGFSYGIVIAGDDAFDNLITGCFVGTDASGCISVPNSDHGIDIRTASNNRIGGLSIEERNIVSGNEGQGISVSQSASYNIVQGNFVGTDVTGTKVLPNGMASVFIDWETDNNIIGGSQPGARNVICGNNTGIWCWGSGNIIEGNYIGTDCTGKNFLGNHLGINIADPLSIENVIIGNLVSGNTAHGIAVRGKYTTVKENVVSYNDMIGIKIYENAVNNTISRNSVFSNAWLGIDLLGDWVTPNDSGDTDSGPNNLMNFPVIESAKATPGKLIVKGTIDTPDPKTVTIEFFANPVPVPGCDESGYGEGAVFLGETNPNSKGKFTAALPAVAQETLITATATDAHGNTSEFAANIEAKKPGH